MMMMMMGNFSIGLGRAVGRSLSPDYGLDPSWNAIKRDIIAAESIEAAQENRRSKKNPASAASSKSKAKAKADPAVSSMEDCKGGKTSSPVDDGVVICFLSASIVLADKLSRIHCC